MDVVYTWVDGSDPAHAELRARYLPNDKGDAGGARCRFLDNDELKYSLRSVAKFAPWFERIFIVTNGQVPSWLDTQHPNVRLVTHEDIFQNPAHLPTFNSNAIEHHLHVIPDLSERFIYFNDDLFLGSEVCLEDFETEAKQPKTYIMPYAIVPPVGNTWIQNLEGTQQPMGFRPSEWYEMMQHVNHLFDERYGRQPRAVVAHVPHVIDKEMVRAFQEDWVLEVQRTISNRFRTNQDLGFPHAYIHYCLNYRDETGQPWHATNLIPRHPNPCQMTFSLGASVSDVHRAFQTLDAQRSKFVCCQTNAEVTSRVVSAFQTAMEQRFPEPSPWERS